MPMEKERKYKAGIDKDATRLYNEHFAELFAAPPKQKKGGGRRKPRGRLLGKRRKAKDVR